MANWDYTYREQEIPGPNLSGTITAHTPGKKLAKAVTEIQERVVVDVETDLEGIEDQGTVVENNTLSLRLKADPGISDVQTNLTGLADEGTGFSDGTLTIGLRVDPEVSGINNPLIVLVGGEWPTLQTQEITVENGLIKSVTDGQLPYPEKELYTGEVIVGATLGLQGETLTLTLTKQPVEAGLVLDGTTTETLNVTIEIPDALPPGGEQYQVLQRDDTGAAVWDYVRAVDLSA